VRLALRVAELTKHENATVLETLAVAYYSAGRTNEAMKTAAAAIELASRTGTDASTRDMRQRLEFYALKFLAGGSKVRPQDQ
jgi:hypothetical protein